MKNILFFYCFFVGLLANCVVFGQKNKDEYERLLERSNVSIKILEEKVQQLEYLQKLQLENVREQNRNLHSKDTTYFGNMTRMVQISIRQIDENYQKQLKEVKAQKIDTEQELEVVLNAQKNKFDNETTKQNLLFMYEAIGVIALNIILFIILGAVLRGRQERFFEEISRKDTQELKTALLAEVKELSYKELERAITQIKNESQKTIQKVAATDIEIQNQKLQEDLTQTQNQITILTQKLQEEKENRQNISANIKENYTENTKENNVQNTTQNNTQNTFESELLIAQKNEIEKINRELLAAVTLINKINQEKKEQNTKNEAFERTLDKDPYHTIVLKNDEIITNNKNNEEFSQIRRVETEAITVLEPFKADIIEKIEKTVEIPIIQNTRENTPEIQTIINDITNNNTEKIEEKIEQIVVLEEKIEEKVEQKPEVILEEKVEEKVEEVIIEKPIEEIKIETVVAEIPTEIPTETSTEDYLVQAQKAYEERDIENAIVLYGLALAQNPNAVTYTKRGNCYHLLKKLDQATADYQKAIRIDANFIVAYNNAIEIYILTDNFFQALTTLEQLARVEKMPQHKALELYLKLIVQKALNQSSEKTEKDLDEVMRFEFSFNFSFKEISDWLAYADIDPVHKRVIQNKTELLKLKKF